MALSTRPRLRLVAAAAATLVALGACGSDNGAGAGAGSSGSATSQSSSEASGTTGSTADADFPDVIAVELRDDGDTYSLDVTMSSEYDSPERYADGWRVLDPDGNELGTMELAHDHAGEQPFTRSQSGLVIPDGVETITVEGHDLENGYGGATVEVDVPS
ncbi:hypothetical protein [Nocardioides furvisabuli]|uniref:hypothetical protein n=1 Tax=Nocardioides furvisabuli TaxID=375542 RepID=UPI001E5AFBBF|nr:hypothetical protein [Nocardioides furvisabuli]